MRAIGSVLVVCVAVLFAGCSNSQRLIPVTGQVTVNGKPAEGAIVMFHPEDSKLSVGSATAGADGTFAPVTNAEKGLMIGKYKVTIVYPDPTKKPTEAQIMMGTADVGPDLLKGKYGAKANTTLSAEITSETQAIAPFEL